MKHDPNVIAEALQLEQDWNNTPVMPVPMNYFEAVGVFYAFMDSKPCWQPLSKVWPESYFIVAPHFHGAFKVLEDTALRLHCLDHAIQTMAWEAVTRYYRVRGSKGLP